MPRGGKRPNAGRRRGSVEPQTREKRERRARREAEALTKEAAREAVRNLVTAQLTPLVTAQLAHAQGISHFMLRDQKTGKFERITNIAQIEAALNTPNAEEGSSYYIWTKDPSVQAFTDLMNRALDRPKEQAQDLNLTGDQALIAALLRGRERAKGQ